MSVKTTSPISEYKFIVNRRVPDDPRMDYGILYRWHGPRSGYLAENIGPYWHCEHLNPRRYPRFYA